MESLSLLSFLVAIAIIAVLLLAVILSGRNDDRCKHGISYRGICVECEVEAEEEYRSHRIDDDIDRCRHGIPKNLYCFLCNKGDAA